jgi:hypothetical protein
MSTKCSIAHGDSFHLYQDLLDEEHVCLRLGHVDFQASRDEVTVKIPLHLWEFLRSYPGADLSEANKTDDEIDQEASERVGERLAKVEATATASNSASSLLELGGAFVMGPIDLPREQQIANCVQHLRRLRHQQRELLSRIEALKRSQPR